MANLLHRTRPAAHLSLLVLALCATLAGCVVAPVRGPYGGPVVIESPPPPRAEIIGVAPYPGAVWINGSWGRRGHSHAWVPGYWQRPHPGHRWQPHARERDHRGRDHDRDRDRGGWRERGERGERGDRGDRGERGSRH